MTTTGTSEPSRPLPAKDGIKAKTQRGAFGAVVVGQALDRGAGAFGWGSRLHARALLRAQGPGAQHRPRSRARCKAKVQGSRPTPYNVTIEITPLTDAQWERAIDAMARAGDLRRQAAGGRDAKIEEAFAAAGVPLFPQSAREIATDCSCPD